MTKIKKINTKKKGSLLLELLISMSLLGIIIFAGADAVYLSMKSSQASRERDVGTTLANESLEAVRAVSEEKWQNIYGLEKETHYYATLSEGKWILLRGEETVNFNRKNYTRYVMISDVSRDADTRKIEDTYNSTNDDPSTQKVSVTVISPEGYNTAIFGYFFRWKNMICNQTSWAEGQSGYLLKNCSDGTYGEMDPFIIVNDDGKLQLN